jgi:acetyl esterase/lipase
MLPQIAPELRKFVQIMPHMPISSAWGRWIARRMLALMIFDRKVEGVRLEKLITEDGIRLRIYTPDQNSSGAALLWIHGGGMVIGRAIQDDLFCAMTARELGILVVATEYRLAPEFPFPAPLDDCYAAWRWLLSVAVQRQIDPACIAIGGQSAGGGLAASLVQRLHDEGRVQPIAQWLFCPMLDDRTAAKQELDAMGHKIWDNQQNRTGWRAFLNLEPGTAQVPEYAVAARRTNVSGLPSAWIGTGDIELFFNEDKTYAERLSSAGVACTLDIVPGAPHGFESIAGSTKLAQDYLSRARRWLGDTLTAHTHIS